MSPSEELRCRVVATREPASRVWHFYLVNDGGAPIERALLKEVKYEWGDQYVGGKSPDVRIGEITLGERALIWRDDGSSETRIDLWLLVAHRGHETWLLFEFPRLYRQQGTTLEAHGISMGGPP